ncbi:MAG: endonuclease/exonuclease/phosphatase family protein [Spirochaetaceae bacterium]|nr:endonuclease/exonuclease/phosphatase family protein [Spirochaetaceae bacterium]
MKPNRATPDQRSIATEVIRYLTEDLTVDILALGEISSSDIAYLKDSVGLNEYGTYDGTLRIGKILFDTAVFYRTSKLGIPDSQEIVSNRGGHKIKVANKLSFMPNNTKSPIYIFVSHWGSRLLGKEIEIDRRELGMRLRDKVSEARSSCEAPAHIILMGDYNDEPFDDSLAKHLLATRDRELVLKKPEELLYNPFWRHLGEMLPHTPGTTHKCCSGSCYYSNGRETHWHTFDQIIFSAAFIGDGEWQMSENHTFILRTNPLNNCLCSGNDIFDHYPVFTVIERKEING